MKLLDRRRFCDCELAGWWIHVEYAQLRIRDLLADLENRDLWNARQAFFGVLAVAQILRHEVAMAMTSPARLARGKAICDRMLDALAPYVTVVEHEARKLVGAGIDGLEIASSDAN